ncbi:hypothetical protein AGRA3207_006378 [Actinomadura graeca]|uniref:Uncharacterized protein n=1 Tax=Actinomadura graeca TaxID=2750812 RepID=A0ABX8R248_9ACTN|nr:hypothetical protein [Actinomadura graeca]QXJ24958.1 hypothetical protein AGRA3207_006378 [Actinomadura graeca]
MMTVSAGSNPEWTRPDQRLPEPPGTDPPAPGSPAPGDATMVDPSAGPAAPAPVQPAVPPPSPPVQPGPVPPAGGPPGGAALQGGQGWHRLHYVVGVFLLAYGVTGIATAALLWDDRRDEFERYFASGPAVGLLVLVKAVEVLLVLVTAAALVRRRDTWLVPPLAGWMAGFAMFAVLDVLTGRWGGLLEHLVYLAGFVVLLFLSYGLSAKAQLTADARARRAAGADAAGAGPGEGRRLTRTQEFALSAINRLPRR